jgi:prepilin-type N-terminal cleavage/methylation domain-containing protein
MSSQRLLTTGRSAGFTLIEIMIVVLIIGVLVAIALPNFMRAREQSRAKACQANLKEIDSAVQEAMMDGKVSQITVVTQSAPGDSAFNSAGGTAAVAANGNVAAIYLVPTYIRANPACPEGGLYSSGDGSGAAGDANAYPTCSLATSGVDNGEFGSGGAYPHTLGGT